MAAHEYELVENNPKNHPSNLDNPQADIAPSTITATKIPSPGTWDHRLLRSWWLEIGAILLSGIAFAAIIVTLYPHDQQPLPQWPYSISVNALISIFVVVFKAAILFMTAEALSQRKWLWYTDQHPLNDIDVYDMATRGPWGAIKLLWVVGPHDLLTILGAIVTILMVIIDPFTQQLLTYYDCYPPVAGEQASIPLTKLLSTLGTTSIHTGAAQSSVPPEWQQAVNGGIFVPGQKVPFECSSGNCTFPETYTTLSYCSQCEDVSNQLMITNQTLSVMVNDAGTVLNLTGFNSTLPSGAVVYSTAGAGQINYTSMTVHSGPNGRRQVEFILGKTPFDTFHSAFVDNVNATCAKEETIRGDAKAMAQPAAHCFPVSKKFNSSIHIGALHEALLDSSPSDQWKLGAFGPQGEVYSDTMATIDLSCITHQDRKDLQAANYTIQDGQKWLGYNVTWNVLDVPPPDARFPQSLQQRGCLYAYQAPFTDSSLWNYLAGFFKGFVYGYYGAEIDPRLLTGPQHLLQIFNWGNISFDRLSDTFANISDAMTVQTRLSGDTNSSQPATAEVLKSQTCLRVRWPWLSFPAALAVVAWLFFLGTLVSQYFRRTWLPSWKSSLLPVVFAGMSLSTRVGGQSSAITEDIDSLKKTAATMRVQLGETGRGLGLVGS